MNSEPLARKANCVFFYFSGPIFFFAKSGRSGMRRKRDGKHAAGGQKGGGGQRTRRIIQSFASVPFSTLASLAGGCLLEAASSASPAGPLGMGVSFSYTSPRRDVPPCSPDSLDAPKTLAAMERRAGRQPAGVRVRRAGLPARRPLQPPSFCVRRRVLGRAGHGGGPHPGHGHHRLLLVRGQVRGPAERQVSVHYYAFQSACPRVFSQAAAAPSLDRVRGRGGGATGTQGAKFQVLAKAAAAQQEGRKVGAVPGSTAAAPTTPPRRASAAPCAPACAHRRRWDRLHEHHFFPPPERAAPISVRFRE